MKKTAKALLVVLCALILVVGSVFGTLAYLTSEDEVTNTFTVGKINITMDEAVVDAYGVPVTPVNRTVDDADGKNGNEYKLIPGHTYTKDPTIHVVAESEPCYLYAKINNGLGAAATLNLDTQKWIQIGDTNVYYYNETVDAREGAKDVVIFSQFQFAGTADPATYSDKTIVVTAYAVQADTFNDAEAAWTATFGATAEP